jgi:hypothetical protein
MDIKATSKKLNLDILQPHHTINAELSGSAKVYLERTMPWPPPPTLEGHPLTGNSINAGEFALHLGAVLEPLISRWPGKTGFNSLNNAGLPTDTCTVAFTMPLLYVIV